MNYANFILRAWVTIKLASAAIPLKDNLDIIPLTPWSPQSLVQYQRLSLPWFMFGSFGNQDNRRKAWAYKRGNIPMTALKYGPTSIPTIKESSNKDISAIPKEDIQRLPDQFVHKQFVSLAQTNAVSKNRKQLFSDKSAEVVLKPPNSMGSRYKIMAEDSEKAVSDTSFNWLNGNINLYASEKLNSGMPENDDDQIMKRNGNSQNGKSRIVHSHVQQSNLDKPFFPVMIVYKSDKHLQLINNDHGINITGLSTGTAQNYGENGLNWTNYSKQNELGTLVNQTITEKTTDNQMVEQPRNRTLPVPHRIMRRSVVDKRINFCGFLGRLGRPIGTCMRRIRPKAAASFSAYDYLGPHWPVHSMLGGGVG